MVPFESTLERDFATLLEFDDSVARYESQPLEIFYDVAGRRRRGVPDFLVTFADAHSARPLLCDVKYRANLFEKWPELKPRLRAAMAYARANDMSYHIYSEVEIRTTYLRNIRFLLPYRLRSYAEEDKQVLMSALKRLGTSTPEQLLLECGSSDERRAALIPCLWSLIAHRFMKTDLSGVLSMSMVVEWT